MLKIRLHSLRNVDCPLKLNNYNYLSYTLVTILSVQIFDLTKKKNPKQENEEKCSILR